jgi:EAL domain-containing protein (putative c-di-GMP-specific phosphodiesterase class I)
VEFGHAAINASAAGFRSGRLPAEILERLRLAGTPTHYLEAEVTETAFLDVQSRH